MWSDRVDLLPQSTLVEKLDMACRMVVEKLEDHARTVTYANGIADANERLRRRVSELEGELTIVRDLLQQRTKELSTATGVIADLRERRKR